LLHYLVNTIPLDEPFRRVANVVIVVIGVLIVILLSLELRRPDRRGSATPGKAVSRVSQVEDLPPLLLAAAIAA